MPVKDLRTYLAELEAAGELVRIQREVDPRFEIAAIIHRLQREHNKAVVFERVRGSSIPVAGNVLGSHERIARLLGVTKDALSRTWGGMEDDLASWPDGCGELTDEPYEEVSLDSLPILTHCEKDGGPYITAGVALAADPISGIYNLSYHRIQVADPSRLGFRITPGNHLGVYHQAAEARAFAAGGGADRRTPGGDAGGGGPAAPPCRRAAAGGCVERRAAPHAAVSHRRPPLPGRHRDRGGR